MKQKKEKKLGLNKETIQDFDTVLGKDDQKWIKGGSQLVGPTQVPIFC